MYFRACLKYSLAALNIVKQPSNSQNGSRNMLPSPQEDTNHTLGRPKQNHIQYKSLFSNLHCHNCTEMRKHKQTGALAAHLISTKRCRIAADMTCVFKQAAFRHTHTGNFIEASQARLKQDTAKTLCRM